MNGSQGVTLEAVLSARDRRNEKQLAIINRYSASLISFMVNMPGAVKNSPASLLIFEEGLSVLLRALEDMGKSAVLYKEIRYYDTGSEALLSVAADEMVLKRIMVNIEESHFLGRLFDFDVLDSEGCSVSRETLGFPKRKCFLCDGDAHACGRSRKHSIDDLIGKIQRMAENFFFGTNFRSLADDRVDINLIINRNTE
jgi:holo-ACP synthase